MEGNKNYRLRALILNPITLIIYGITCYFVYSLLQYGGVKRRVPYILAGSTILIVWSIGCIFKYRNKNNKPHNNNRYLKVWYFIGVFIFISTTIVTGINLYKSSTNFNGKLAWLIHDYKHKRKIKLTNNNIYDTRLEGVFNDIKKKIDLPDELYLANEFRLRFNKDGDIEQIYCYMYGENHKGKIESFLVSYNKIKSKDIVVYLDGYVEADFKEEMRLKPFIDIMEWISLEEIVQDWNEEGYELLYAGTRNWGYNTDGIIYINKNLATGQIEIDEDKYPEEEIIGYTLSIYVPDKEDVITPIRYIHNGLKVTSIEEDERSEQWDVGYNNKDGEETYFLNKRLGYQLKVVDAALGSRFYALFQTQDGGGTWQTMNPDPFLNNTGVSSGITFINEELGFIGLSHSGGDYGELYRTEDGGISFEKVMLPEIEVELNDQETYTPFDFPEMPYEEDGRLILLVGQGQDGDYNSGIKAIYESTDNGRTFIYR